MTGLEIAALAAALGSTGIATGAATRWWSRARHARAAANRAAALYGLGLRTEDGREWTGTLRGRAVRVHVQPERATAARTEVPCMQAGFRLSPRSRLSRILPSGGRTGDRDFDAAVKVDGPPAAVLSVLNPDLRESLRTIVPELRIRLDTNTLFAAVPSGQMSTALPALVELAEQLDGRDDLGSEPLHHAALTDPDGGVRIRAISGLIQTDTDSARAALRDLATRSPDWLGRVAAARHVGDVVLLTAILSDPDAPGDVVQSARRGLDEGRAEGLGHLLETLPDPTDDETTVLAHLKAIRRLLRSGDDVAPLIRWCHEHSPVPAPITSPVLGILRAARTRAAAHAAVAMLVQTPDASSDTVSLVGSLVVHAGTIEDATILTALTARRPDLADLLAPALRSLELRSAAERVAATCGLEPQSEKVVQRALRIELGGLFEGRRASVQLDHDGADVSVEGAPQDAVLRLQTVPSEPPPPALLQWLHPDVRDQLKPLLERGHSVWVYRGTFRVRTSSPAEVPDLLGRGARLVATLSDLPLQQSLRSALAFEAEPLPDWRLAHLQAMPASALSDVRVAALSDPDPRVRVEAAMRLSDLPTLLAIATDPQTAPVYGHVVLRELEGQSELAPAALGAIRAGVVPTSVQVGLVLDVVQRDLAPTHEPLLLHLIEIGDAHQRRVSVECLAAVGSADAVPALRMLAERWLPGPVRDEAVAAIEAIRTRSGAEVGAVSLADPTTGGLSEVDREAEGGLSEPEPDAS